MLDGWVIPWLGDHMAPLHTDEVEIDEGIVRRLVDHQFPDWAQLELTPAGHGTDNRMLRLGDDLVVRLPRWHRPIPTVSWVRRYSSSNLTATLAQTAFG